LARGLRTFPLRCERQAASALALARALEGDRRIAWVRYPGLPSHPDHAVAARLLERGSGSMVAFDAGSLARARAFFDALRVVKRAASLGAVESLASLPLLSSHRDVPPAERAAQGIPDGLVRLSVGIEDPDDLLADLDRGLAAAARA
ncbi:MAG TPA: PLP-dependent transferase, partial [Planctomycetota bacterium]|nr:PLP-dependent transferase [Planctomycetota bacterium]